MQIQISYEVPDVLVPFGSAVSPLVEQILRADLQRFSEFSCKVSTAMESNRRRVGDRDLRSWGCVYKFVLQSRLSGCYPQHSHIISFSDVDAE